MRNDIPLQIQGYRAETKQSQMELAKALSISQPLLSNMEAGRAPISAEMVELLIEHGVIEKELASIPEAVKEKVGRMAYEDQCLVESFIDRMLS